MRKLEVAVEVASRHVARTLYGTKDTIQVPPDWSVSELYVIFTILFLIVGRSSLQCHHPIRIWEIGFPLMYERANGNPLNRCGTLQALVS